MSTERSAYDATYAEWQLGRSRSLPRRLVKSLYLNNILRDVRGPTIDFGCGAGQLLARLPEGSIGLEVNPSLVEALTRRGLDVVHYDPEADQFRLAELRPNAFKTFVMAHVLEHFEDAANSLKRLLGSCRRLGVERVIVVVPGARGYASDDTHRTFVNRAFLEEHGLLEFGGYAVTSLSFFPINMESLGRLFAYHELKIIFDPSSDAEAPLTQR